MAEHNDETTKPDALNDLFRDLDDLLAATPESALPAAAAPAAPADLDDEVWRSLGLPAAEPPSFLGQGFESAPVAARLEAELAAPLPASGVSPAPAMAPLPEAPTAQPETTAAADFDFDRLLELPEPPAPAVASESAEAAPSEPDAAAAPAPPPPPPPAFDAAAAARELLAEPLPEETLVPETAEMAALPEEPPLPPPAPQLADLPFPELSAAAVAAAVPETPDAMDDAIGWFNRGNDLRTQGALGRAAECYERAIALDPDCIRAYCNLAGVLAELGERREALSFLQAALKRDPGNTVLQENLAGLRRAERRRRRW